MPEASERVTIRDFYGFSNIEAGSRGYCFLYNCLWKPSLYQNEEYAFCQRGRLLEAMRRILNGDYRLEERFWKAFNSSIRHSTRLQLSNYEFFASELEEIMTGH